MPLTDTNADMSDQDIIAMLAGCASGPTSPSDAAARIANALACASHDTSCRAAAREWTGGGGFSAVSSSEYVGSDEEIGEEESEEHEMSDSNIQQLMYGRFDDSYTSGIDGGDDFEAELGGDGHDVLHTHDDNIFKLKLEEEGAEAVESPFGMTHQIATDGKALLQEEDAWLHDLLGA